MTASDPREFSGKHVLVTGGTKGAGKAIADRFLQGGATVAITARSAPTERTPLTTSRRTCRHPRARRRSSTKFWTASKAWTSLSIMSAAHQRPAAGS